MSSITPPLSARTQSDSLVIREVQRPENSSKKKAGNSQSAEQTDRVTLGLDEVYKSLTVVAHEVLAKLNEIIGEKVPGGVYELKPEEHTPEKTAQRIVDGTVALFGAYQRQNPKLEGEELLNGFMKVIRGGIKSGYEDAARILGDVGAFEIEGVESEIAKTMTLVEEKLVAFEEQYKAQLKPPSDSEEPQSDSSLSTQ